MANRRRWVVIMGYIYVDFSFVSVKKIKNEKFQNILFFNFFGWLLNYVLWQARADYSGETVLPLRCNVDKQKNLVSGQINERFCFLNGETEKMSFQRLFQ